ncbi:MAG: alpha-N-arabinofuranosidase [Lachnospiraceae bacterium]|nr:alpha-N-arabinofuranosidase [Lachnospiraceae bacterium]
MSKAKIILDKDFTNGKISKGIFGSFIEHMGRVVYSGIYEPGHPDADENGFRRDVIEKINKMGVALIRYPGGNFVSNYDWRDGVGPKENRPKRREIAWKSIETNEFGTDEFMKWVSNTNAEPVFAVNLGTMGIRNALSFLEYMNLPEGTFYSDMRAKNGHKKPYGIKKWCLGNEMDGNWQVGHKNAYEYGRLAAETAHAMKMMDDSIELIVCGSSKSSMPTFTEWEKTVLEETYDYVDYMALHQYYGNQSYGSADFLAQSLDMDNYIETVASIIRTVKARKHSKKDIKISIDEWGVWEIPDCEVADSVSSREWQVAPAFSEQIYTMEDALLFASLLMSMVRHADVVKAACQSLLTNISACIMTEKGGGSWVQPIYYPFEYMARYATGEVLNSSVTGDKYESRFGDALYVDQVCTYDREKNEIAAFFVNRSSEPAELTIDLRGAKASEILEDVSMYSENIKTTNLTDHNAVHPVNSQDFCIDGSSVTGKIKPYSWNMVRISL